MTDTGRPQDQGRRHRSRAAGSDASRTLLADWYSTLRVQLRWVIDELAPKTSDQTTLDGQPKIEAPGPTKRRELVELGDRIAKALGSEVDPPAPPAPRSTAGAPRVPKGGFG